MSVGFIMYEIADMDSLKYQGINTFVLFLDAKLIVGYSLKYQGINTSGCDTDLMYLLDIHLNIKVLTPKKRKNLC